MKQKAIPALVSWFAVSVLASVTLWQFLVVALLFRALTGVLEVLGRVL
jgi:hypothetical protein